MKFTAPSSDLLKHLQAVQGVINTNSVLPILENFLFVIQGSTLSISTTDLHTSMTTSMTIESNEDIRVAVPSKMLIETIKALPPQPLMFDISESFGIEIKTANGLYKLNGENGDDFPRIPEMDQADTLNMPSNNLLNAISTCVFAAGNDEMRLAMTGVFFELHPDSISFVATDAHKLVLHKCKGLTISTPGSFIIPKKAINLLKSVLPDNDTLVNVEYNTVNVFFSFNNINLICRLIDQKYPDYKAVIPTGNDNVLTINRAELLNSLKRISIYSNKTTYQIRMKINGSLLQLSAEDLDFSNQAVERLDCDYAGEDIEIGFNARFLLEMLNNLHSTDVKFEMSMPSRPGLMSPTEQDGNENTLMLIMPVMLNNYL